MCDHGIPALMLHGRSLPGSAQVSPVCHDSEGWSHELPSLGEDAYVPRLASDVLLQLASDVLLQLLLDF